MKLYRIRARENSRATTDAISEGFPTRESAAKYAAGLAASGRAIAATIESYEPEGEGEPNDEAVQS